MRRGEGVQQNNQTWNEKREEQQRGEWRRWARQGFEWGDGESHLRFVVAVFVDVWSRGVQRRSPHFVWVHLTRRYGLVRKHRGMISHTYKVRDVRVQLLPEC